VISDPEEAGASDIGFRRGSRPAGAVGVCRRGRGSGEWRLKKGGCERGEVGYQTSFKAAEEKANRRQAEPNGYFRPFLYAPLSPSADF
jgi:hypothetical protein